MKVNICFVKHEGISLSVKSRKSIDVKISLKAVSVVEKNPECIRKISFQKKIIMMNITMYRKS